MQTTLKNEQAKLARIAERLHAARLAAEVALSELATAETAVKAELEAAILEERASNVGPLERKIAALQATFRSKQAELNAAADAQKKQRVTVEGIEGEIKARQRADAIARARPLCARLVDLQNEASKLALDVQIALAGENAQVDELFSTGENPYTMMARYGMLNNLANFLNELTMFNPKLRGELFRRHPGRMPETWERDAA